MAEGSSGNEVRLVQYFLNVIAEFNDFIPTVESDGYYGAATSASVRAFQKSAGIAQSGIVDKATWDALYSRYTSVVASLPDGYLQNNTAIYPGTVMRRGMSGNNIRLLQTYLSKISQYNTMIPHVNVTGYFGTDTERAVLAFQQEYGLSPKGVVGLSTWNEISKQYNNIILSEERTEGQYPGYVLSEGGG